MHDRFQSLLQTSIKISTLVLFGFLSAASYGQQKTINIRGEPLTAPDISVLPPVCKLIVVDQPAIHLGAGNGPLAKYASLFEEPQYQLAKGNPHLHHYCWALISKQRYFRERDKRKRDFYFAQYMGDIDYVLRKTDKNWPHFNVLYLEQASMYMIRGNYPASILKTDEALRSNPGAEKAYIIKSDAYKAMGNKEMAIKVAQVGLHENPESSPLRRRLIELGITPAAPPKRLDETVVSSPAPADGIASQTAPPPEKAIGSNAETKPSAAPDSQANAVKSVETITAPTNTTIDTNSTTQSQKKTGSDNPPDNPYCRFCP